MSREEAEWQFAVNVWGVLDCWLTWWEGLFAGIAEQFLPRWRYEMTPYCLQIAENGLCHGAARFYKTNAGRFEQWQTLGQLPNSSLATDRLRALHGKRPGDRRHGANQSHS